MRFLALALALVLPLIGGCVTGPPGTEADRLKTEVIDFSDSLRAVATAQLADADASNDGTARQVMLGTSIVSAILTGDTTGIVDPKIQAIVDAIVNHDLTALTPLIATAIKDPYAAGVTFWITRKLEQWLTAQDAEASSKIIETKAEVGK